ncbi:MAG: hypothetical protein R6V86_04655 [Spirochaetia bacterium]
MSLLEIAVVGYGWSYMLIHLGLEGRVCECYNVIRDEFNRLLPDVKKM